VGMSVLGNDPQLVATMSTCTQQQQQQRHHTNPAARPDSSSHSVALHLSLDDGVLVQLHLVSVRVGHVGCNPELQKFTAQEARSKIQ
jgi:hypothetical protein